MTGNYKEGHVDSCVIVAEVNGSNNRYFVAPEDAAQSMKLIENTIKVFANTKPKVYVSGFTLVTEGTNLSQQEILNKVSIWAELVQPKEHGIVEFHK